MDVDDKVALLKTIADATRLRILGLLATRPHTGVELTVALDLTAPTISHHLHRLRDAGIVTATGTPSSSPAQVVCSRCDATKRGLSKCWAMVSHRPGSPGRNTYLPMSPSERWMWYS